MDRFDSDFQVLLDSYDSKKVSNEMLQKCDLLYVCKMCRTIFCKLEKYAEHYDQCDRNVQIFKSRTSIWNASDKVSVEEFLGDEAEDIECHLNIQIKREPVECAEEMRLKIESVTSIKCEEFAEESADQDGRGPSDSNTVEANYYVVLNQKYEDVVDYKNKTCLKCDRTFQSGHATRLHLAVKHLGYEHYKCKFCQFKSSSKAECRKHAAATHKGHIQKAVRVDGMGECFCNLNVGFPGVHKKRWRTRRNDRGKMSNNQTDDGRNLTEALRDQIDNGTLKAADVRSLRCSFCRLTFTTKTSLRRHLAIFHLGGKTYRCGLCPFQGNFTKELRDHIDEAHKDRRPDGEDYKGLIVRNNFNHMGYF